MIFISDIPHLKVYKQRALLPIEEKAQSMYSIVFIDNNSLQGAIDLIENKYLFHNNKFHFYYMDQNYQGKLFNRSYRYVLRKERNQLYDELESKLKYINTITQYDMLNERNVYFDLARYNAIYFSFAKKAKYELRVKGYIDFLKSTISNKRFDAYKHKTICISLEDWMKDVKSAIKGKPQFDNPVYILYFAMYKYFNKFKELGDINLIFYSDNATFRVNPSLCDEKSYQIFKREIVKVSPKVVIADDDSKMEQDIRKQDIYDSVISNFKESYKLTGGDDDDYQVDAEFEKSMEDQIDKVMSEEEIDPTESDEELRKKLETKIMSDQRLIKDIYEYNQSQKTGRTTASLKRDEELRKRQKDIKMDKLTIEQIKSTNTSEVKIPHIDITEKVDTTNKNMTKVRYPHFEKSYNENLMKKDLVNNLTFLNEKSIPVYVRDIKVKDTSDELNYKETYTVQLEDANRVRHTLTFDMPKFIDDKFMYLGGNKKMIVKQLFMKPVVKTGPDEVQICSNYNKIFIRRYGKKLSSKVEKIKKALSTPKPGIQVKYGNNVATNAKYKSVLEYDELSKEFTYIRMANCEFMFNQDQVQEYLTESKHTLKENEFCIGRFIKQNDPIIIDVNTQMLGDGMDIVDFMLSASEGKLVQDFEDASTGKKFMYSRATIMKKQVPLILLLGYVEGLSTVLRKANIKHYFSDKRPKPTVNEGMVQFADGYLVYEKYPFENSLLMNAFGDMPFTKGFEYAEFDSKSAYLSIFDIMFNNKLIGNAFDNFYEFMIDPITKEVLTDLNYPTEFVELLLFGNALLADNSYIMENNMNLYRVRSNELVNALLYKRIADAYCTYRTTANNNNPVKITIPPDSIIKDVLTGITVEDYSTLNPIVELEKSRAITPKGHSGMNMEQAYTQDKRSYDRTMMGLLSISTSPDANCGVVRQLTLEPNIVSPRGYIDLKDDKIDELTDANLFSPAELLSPLGVTRDDSIRTAMATKQSKHIIPIAKASPVLISNGAEQVIQYHLSNDFVVRATDDGEVVETNADTGITVVKFKNGETQAIDTKPRVVKNGAGGFYLSNQLSCDLKKGQKFKKNDLLAYDKHFFTNDKIHGNRFNIGSLQKVACLSSYATYEDSTFITKKLSSDMASDIVMQKSVALGKNSNVDYIVNIGQKVQVGDELIRFDMSFQEDSLNKFLTSVGSELREEIKSLGKTPVKTKYSGVIEDIKIYSTVDADELSPTLKKIVTEYYSKINKKKAQLNKYDKSESIYKCGVLLNEATKKILTKDGKIKGHDVGEGVLIEFYIRYKDTLGVGDKITFFTALKSIIGEVIPEGYEPYSEFRPNEEVSSVIGPSAILQRATPSILLTMFGNKVLVELKRKLQEIYEEKPWQPIKEGIEKTQEEILFESVVEIYRAKNIDDDQSYFANTEFSEGQTICPLFNNNKASLVGIYIKPSNTPNCDMIGDMLVAKCDISEHDELTVSQSVYNKIQTK